MKKDKVINFILVIIFIAGLSLLLYPSVSNYWNSLHQTKAIASYNEEVTKLDSTAYDKILSEARDYNEKAKERNGRFELTEEELEEYNNTLDITGTGIMAYIEIPSIRVTLPIYHGVDDTILQVAAGHLDWSTLPIGGDSTHCVVSGHRGLPSAKLFTEIDRLVTGDIFMFRVLNEVYTYEVDQIRIVEPEEIDELLITEGEDYCTLVTCTPYGINSHRLLIRGHRIENGIDISSIRIVADAVKIDPLIVAPVVAIPIFIVFLIILLKSDKRRKEEID